MQLLTNMQAKCMPSIRSLGKSFKRIHTYSGTELTQNYGLSISMGYTHWTNNSHRPSNHSRTSRIGSTENLMGLFITTEEAVTTLLQIPPHLWVVQETNPHHLNCHNRGDRTTALGNTLTNRE